MMLIRPMRMFDIAAVCKLAADNYPKNYLGSEEALASKITGYMRGCFVAEIAGEIVGYIISGPGIIGQYSERDEFYTPPSNADCLYIHELCIKLGYRDRRVGSKLFTRVLDFEWWPKICLVAFMSAGGWWRQFGFRHVCSVEYCDAVAEYMRLDR
jgi:ribosomal protein S18 acetylase RimI-like enzyme